MKTIVAVMLFSVMTTAGGGGLAAEGATQTVPVKETFLVIYRPGPAWPDGAPISSLPLKEHGAYMLGLFEKGLMTFAGPLTDDAGGAVVLTVSDAAEAAKIVADDPAVRAGIFLQEMHPWRLVPWAEHAEKRKAREKE